jgi:hypothetical protein
MRKIDWNEKLEFYNKVFGTTFEAPVMMRQHLYKKFPSLMEAGLKIDVSPESLRRKLIEDGVRINPQGYTKKK